MRGIAAVVPQILVFPFRNSKTTSPYKTRVLSKKQRLRRQIGFASISNGWDLTASQRRSFAWGGVGYEQRERVRHSRGSPHDFSFKPSLCVSNQYCEYAVGEALIARSIEFSAFTCLGPVKIVPRVFVCLFVGLAVTCGCPAARLVLP